MLPPLANLVAFSSPDPGRLAELRQKLEADTAFESVRSPAPGWVLARAPLAGTGPEPKALVEAGLAFAEGEDVAFPNASSQSRDEIEDRMRPLERSPDSLHHLAGDFGFIRFQSPGSALLARSVRGLVPFYWHADRNLVAVATWMTGLVRHLPFEPEPDLLTCAIWTGGMPAHPDQRSLIRDIRVLPPGHALRLRHFEAGAPIAYWQPPPAAPRRPSPAAVQERQREFRRLLLSGMDRDLDAEQPNLLLWSGGADSSALAALAVNQLGRSVFTTTAVPRNGPDVEHEARFREHLRQHVPLPPLRELGLDTLERIHTVPKSPPVATMALHPLGSLIHRDFEKQPFSVLFGGEFADELCGCANRSLWDWALQTGPLELAREVATHGHPVQTVGRWGKRRWKVARYGHRLPIAYRVPPFFESQIRAEFDEWLPREEARFARLRRDWHYVRYFLETLSDTTAAMYWEFCSALGVRRTVPFLTRDLLELSLSCHISEHIGATGKRLLRGALGEDVPRLNLERPKESWRHIEQRDTSSLGVPPPRKRAWLSPDWDFSDEQSSGFALWQVALLDRFTDSIDEILR